MFGAVLAPPWGRLGGLLGRRRAILEASWALWGRSFGPLGPSWAVGWLGHCKSQHISKTRMLASPGSRGGLPGGLLGRLGGLLGAPRAALGRLRGPSCELGGILGRLGGHLGLVWASLEAILGHLGHLGRHLGAIRSRRNICNWFLGSLWGHSGTPAGRAEAPGGETESVLLGPSSLRVDQLRPRGTASCRSSRKAI
eukprot:7515456-Pyramimonas_sp.AAC.1